MFEYWDNNHPPGAGMAYAHFMKKGAESLELILRGPAEQDPETYRRGLDINDRATLEMRDFLESGILPDTSDLQEVWDTLRKGT